ncbi:MAG TPA: triose-phosphate isomerase [Sedimentisphaerales bacterium]|nr:triose-phosphate isomerase [Sedimentisphaerales bacterium]
MRKPFIAGNWKMNTTSKSAVALVNALKTAVKDVTAVDIAVAPPFVYLLDVARAAAGSNVAVAAQNVYYEGNGAFTGEISCDMLKDAGCTYVIIGHSERRHVIGEKDELINKKVLAALKAGLKPILCVGELLAERESDKTVSVVTDQTTKGLLGVGADEILNVTIAYEPVWAIGTGRNATPDQAQEVHAMIRRLIAKLYSQPLADKLRMQYGGSAKPSNAAELVAQKDVDGLLVGGASLKADDFAAMIRAAQ